MNPIEQKKEEMEGAYEEINTFSSNATSLQKTMMKKSFVPLYSRDQLLTRKEIRPQSLMYKRNQKYNHIQ